MSVKLKLNGIKKNYRCNQKRLASFPLDRMCSTRGSDGVIERGQETRHSACPSFLCFLSSVERDRQMRHYTGASSCTWNNWRFLCYHRLMLDDPYKRLIWASLFQGLYAHTDTTNMYTCMHACMINLLSNFYDLEASSCMHIYICLQLQSSAGSIIHTC